jgi:hypothetical protein
MQVIGGGGDCNKGDALIRSAPVYDHMSEGWGIQCAQADKYGNQYGRQDDKCVTYAICVSYSFQQQNGYY